MVYHQKLVAVIKSQGKVLREDSGTVSLPFGSEYSILVKNLDSRRIQFKVSVDGEDATENRRLIVGPNAEVELERFIRGGNLSAGNRFKFIERTSEIENHRGVGAEDGLVRIEAWTEIPRPTLNLPIRPLGHNQWDSRGGQHTNSILRGSRAGRTSASGPSGSSMNQFRDAGSRATLDSAFLGANVTGVNTVNDQGITVAGSESDQQFVNVQDFPVEVQSNVVVLRLRGVLGNQMIVQPVTVQSKPKCGTCGRLNKGGSKFCTNCGTSLILL